MKQPSEHLLNEKVEQEIIKLASSFPHIRHDYDDCGLIHPSTSALEVIILDIENPNFTAVPKKQYLDAFLSMQVKDTGNVSYQQFFTDLNSFLSQQGIGIRKAETTFIKQGFPYSLLALTYSNDKAGDNKIIKPETALLGTIDAYVSQSHFLLERNPVQSGFYAACAAISDIGASGGIPIALTTTIVNGNDRRYVEGFCQGIAEAVNFNAIPVSETREFFSYYPFGEMAVVFTVIGSVDNKKHMTLKGLEEWMSLYVAGSVGGAAALNYDNTKAVLMQNLDPAFRKTVRDAITQPALCNDVSDGVEKSLGNFLRYAQGLSLEVSEAALCKAAYNNSVTLDNIKYGGDDYSLVIATHSDLEKIEGVTKVGVVRKGEGKIRH